MTDRSRRESIGLEEQGHYHSTEDRNQFIIVWKTKCDTDLTRKNVAAMFGEVDLETLDGAGGRSRGPRLLGGMNSMVDVLRRSATKPAR